MTLLAVGSVAFDDLETPSGVRENVLGGSVSYFSLSASSFHPVQVVAVAGEDFGEEEFRVFRDRPIDLRGLELKAGKCFRWKGVYGDNLNEARTLETHLNVFQDFRPDLPADFRQSPYLFLGNIDPALQLDVLGQMNGRPRWVALDTMNFWIQGAREALDQVLRQVDILLVNEGEARALSGEQNLVKASRAIRNLGPRIIVVKRGEYGAVVFAEEGMVAVPAMLLEHVVDPTGAGDTFAGGFLGYLAAQGTLDLDAFRRAIIAGTVMASFTVQNFGLRGLEVATEQDIKDRTQAFSDMIRAGGL
jgi:sugar/nucleoside kinase (ribokinase family)